MILNYDLKHLELPCEKCGLVTPNSVASRTQRTQRALWYDEANGCLALSCRECGHALLMRTKDDQRNPDAF